MPIELRQGSGASPKTSNKGSQRFDTQERKFLQTRCGFQVFEMSPRRDDIEGFQVYACFSPREPEHAGSMTNLAASPRTWLNPNFVANGTLKKRPSLISKPASPTPCCYLCRSNQALHPVATIGADTESLLKSESLKNPEIAS